MYDFANLGFQRLNGRELSQDEYKAMSRSDKRYWAKAGFNKDELRAMENLVKTLQGDQAGTSGENFFTNQMVQRQILLEQESEMDKAGIAGQEASRLLPANINTLSNRNDDGSLKPLPTLVADDAAPTDLQQLRNHYAVRLQELPQNISTLESKLQQLEAAKAQVSAAAGADPTQTQAIDEQISRTQDALQLQQEMAPHYEWLLARLQDFETGLGQVDPNLPEEKQLEAKALMTAKINELLDRAYRGFDENGNYSQSLRQAAAIFRLRPPFTSASSISTYAPAIDFVTVKTGQRGWVLQPITGLDKIEGDFDGDRSSSELALLVSTDVFEDIATGRILIVSTDGVPTFKIGSTANDVKTVTNLQRVARGEVLQGLEGYPPRLLMGFAEMVKKRYKLTDKVANRFFGLLHDTFLASKPDWAKGLDAEAIRKRELDIQEDPMSALGQIVLSIPELNTTLFERAAHQQHKTNEPEILVSIFRSFLDDAAGHMNSEHTSRLIKRMKAEGIDDAAWENEQTQRATKLTRSVGEVRYVRTLEAATLMQTLIMVTGNDSLLRLGGVIKYNPEIYTDVEAVGADQDALFSQATTLMNQLAKGSTKLAAEPGPDTFDVSGRVLVMARNMLASSGSAINLDRAVFDFLQSKVQQFSYDDAGNARPSGRQVTMAQVLSEVVVRDIELTAGITLDRDADKRAKIDMIKSAARATEDGAARSWGEMMLMREAVGGMVVADIVGEGVSVDDWGAIIPTGTVEQNVRRLWMQDSTERHRLNTVMKGLPAYQQGGKAKELIDLILEIHSTELSFDVKGVAHGRAAKRNNDSSANFQTIRTAVQQALKDFPTEVGKTPRNEKDRLLRFFSSQMGAATQLIDALVSQVGIAAFETQADGTVRFRDWVLDSLLEKDANKAEMILWRGRTWSILQKFGNRRNREDEDAPRDTMANLLYELEMKADPILREKVMTEFMKEGQTRKNFEEWVARELPLPTTPILMYENSTEQFSPSQSKGGWGAAAPTLRFELDQIVQRITELPNHVREHKLRQETNTAVAEKLRKKIREGRHDDPKVQQFRRMREHLGTRPLTLTPDTVVDMLVRLLEVGTDMHVKGGALEALQVLSKTVTIDMLQTAWVDPSTEVQNLMLDVLDMEDVREFPDRIFAAEKLIDDYGREIDLSVLRDANGQITDDSLLTAIIDHPSISDLIVEALLPKSHSYFREADMVTTTFTSATTLEEAFERPNETRAFQREAGKDFYTRAADFAFGIEVSARMQQNDPSQVAPFERRVLNMVLARTSAAEGMLNPAQVANLVVSSWQDLARALRSTAQFAHTSITEDSLNIYTNMVEDVQRTQREAAAASLAQRDSERGQLKANLNQERSELHTAAKDIIGELLAGDRKDRIQELVDQAIKLNEQRSSMTQEEFETARNELRDAKNTVQMPSRVENYLEAALGGDYLGQLEALYLVEHSVSAQQKSDITNYLESDPSILTRVIDENRPLLQDFYGTEYSDPVDTAFLDVSQWNVLSRIVISDILRKNSVVLDSTSDSLIIMGDDRAAFDPTFARQLDMFKEPGSGLMEAASQVVAESPIQHSADIESVRRNLLALYDPSKAPMWSPEFAATSQAFDAAFSPITAKDGAGLSGNLPKLTHAMATAATRSWAAPPADYMVQVQVRRTSEGLVLVQAPDNVPFDVLDLEGAFGTLTDSSGNPIDFMGINLSRENMAYQAFSENIISNALEKANIPTSEVVTVSFFSPHYRPAGNDFLNNVYFDGIIAHESVQLPAYDSLIGEGFFAPNGVNQLSQRVVLDAVKKKVNAVFRMKKVKFNLPPGDSSYEVLVSYFNRLANEFIETDLGFGRLGSIYYKFALKLFQMRHIVRYSDGTVVPVTDHLAALQADQDATLALGPELIKLSRRQANTLYGEVGNQGLLMGLPGAEGVGRGGNIFTFDNLSPRQQRVLDNLGQKISLADTPIATRAPLRRATQSVREATTEAFRSVDKYLTLAQTMQDGAQKRFDFARKTLGMSYKATRMRAIDLARELTEKDATDAAVLDSLGALEAAEELASASGAYDGTTESSDLRLGLRLSPNSQQNYTTGELTPSNFSAFQKDLGGLYGDFVVVNLNLFEKVEQRDFVKMAIRTLALQNVEIRLHGQGGTLRREITEMLTSMNYTPVTGSANSTFAPDAAVAGYQLERSWASRAMAQDKMTSKARLWGLIIDEGQKDWFGLLENAAYIVDPEASVVLNNNIIKRTPSENRVPAHESQMGDIRDILDSLTDAEWTKAFKRTSGEVAGTLTLQEAREDLEQRASSGSVDLTRNGTMLRRGMFSVHIVQMPDSQYGDQAVLYLHREGSRWMSDDVLKERYRAGDRIIISDGKPEQDQTFHEGVVVGHEPTAGNGDLRVHLQTTLQTLANKYVSGSGAGGIKLMAADLPQELLDVLTPLFSDNSAGKIDVVAFAEDMRKKRNMYQTATNFSETAAVLGVDLMPLFYEGLYGEAYRAEDTNHKNKMIALESALNALSRGESMDTYTAAANIDALSGEHMSQFVNSIPAIHELLGAEVSSALQEATKGEQTTAATKALLAAINYLSTQGARLDDIARASGFASSDSQNYSLASHRMANLFTRIFDRDTELKKWAIGEFNKRFIRTSGMEGWMLDSNYSLQRLYTDKDGNQRSLSGTLSYMVFGSVGESTDTNFQPGTKRPLSTHDNRWAESSAGAMFANKYEDEAFKKYFNSVTASADTYTGYEVQSMVPGKEDNAPRPFSKSGVARMVYESNVARKLSPYFQRIDIRSDEATTPEMIASVEGRITDLANRLFDNADGSAEHYVHYLIRFRWGMPGPSKNDPEGIGHISVHRIDMALKAIEEALDAGRSPLYRGVINWVPPEIASAIYRAQSKRTLDKYQPRIYTGRRSEFEQATTFEQYVEAFTNDAIADSGMVHNDAVNQILDAILHQYQSRTQDLLFAPISIELMNDLKLISHEAHIQKALESALENKYTLNEFLTENPDAAISSLNPLTELMLTPTERHSLPGSATMARMLGNEILQPLLEDMPITDEIREATSKRWANWHKKNDIPYSTKKSLMVYRATGVDKTDSEPKAHAFVRSLMGVRAFLALINPALMVAGLYEATWKRSIGDTRKLLTGQSTGLIGRHVNRMVNKAIAQDNSMGVLVRGMGFMPLYTPEQAERKRAIVANSATLGTLRNHIHETLGDYHNGYHDQGVPKWIRKLGKLGAGMQDMSRGTKAKTMTTLYIDAVVNDMANKGFSVDFVLEALATNPVWLVNEHADSHLTGIAAMNDVRGTQQTVLNKMVEAFYKPMTTSGNAGINAFGHLFFAMPLMFSKYAANFTLTATGLRGMDQLAAHALQGRQKPSSFFGQLASKSRGEALNVDDMMDMDDVIGGLDAMDSIINMGITHSQLFIGGLLLQGLGLSGEDEETKRRRRAAEAQGAAFVYDPLRLENDFRNVDTIFLDWMPAPLAQYFASVDANGEKRSYAQLHWTVKQVTSPLLGMERFFNTGDFRQVWWGFTDAIGSMPLLNSITFDKSLTMAGELTKAAADASVGSGPNALPNTVGFLGSTAAYFESMLLESAFLNSIYIGLDEYDRDPYVLPLRDSDGDLQRDVEGNVRANSDQHLRSDGIDGRGLAMETYTDENGQLKRGYLSPSNATTQSRVMAESRLSYAIISSLFTGISGKGSNLRYNMPVKTRSFEKPEMTEREQEGLILGGLRASEEFQSFVMEGFKEGASQEQQAISSMAMSFLDGEGNEILTDEGAMAVFKGIAGGLTPIGSEALSGVYIDFQTRQRIQTRWLGELTQEGINMGLSERSAKYFAKQVWYGPQDGSTPGIQDVLWSDEIEYSKTQEYQQLNTTYIMGPDGTPWATGFTRPKLLGALGLAPLQRPYTSDDTGIGQDERGNVSDLAVGINTGSRALRRVDDSWDIPTDVEIGDAITKAIEDLDQQSFGTGGGYRGGGGGGGGYGVRPQIRYADTPRWSNLRLGVEMINPQRHSDVRPVYTDNITLRRAETRRQRISGERGRLKPWQ